MVVATYDGDSGGNDGSGGVNGGVNGDKVNGDKVVMGVETRGPGLTGER